MLIDLNQHYAFIEVSGPDAATFLQGQVSCDVVNIKQSSLGVICDPKGRIQALFRLLKLNDKFYLRLPRAVLDFAFEHLKKYSIFSKVTLNKDITTLFIYGYLNQSPPENKLYALPVFNNESYEVYTQTRMNEADDALIPWQHAAIEAGIPEIYPETIGAFTPHNLNLQCLEAISFNKGCYTGQEIIARMHYRGTLKQHMYHLIAEKKVELAPGDTLQTSHEKTAGTVVCSIHYHNQTHVLASLKDQLMNDVIIDSQAFTVKPLPYSW